MKLHFSLLIVHQINEHALWWCINANLSCGAAATAHRHTGKELPAAGVSNHCRMHAIIIPIPCSSSRQEGCLTRRSTTSMPFETIPQRSDGSDAFGLKGRVLLELRCCQRARAFVGQPSGYRVFCRAVPMQRIKILPMDHAMNGTEILL